MPKNPIDSDWTDNVKARMLQFANRHSTLYSKKKRELWAFFEIGSLIALADLYEKQGCSSSVKNLVRNEYRYKTSPEGNPINFSYIVFEKDGERFELRQQIRIRSHYHEDLSFTPDIVVCKYDSLISGQKIPEYHGGKRKLNLIDSHDVISSHECKSLPPFPELLVSFLGNLFAAHQWYVNNNFDNSVSKDAIHLAPTLFVGGSSRPLHLKMIAALKSRFPVNIITGLHSGTMNLVARSNELKFIVNPYI